MQKSINSCVFTLIFTFLLSFQFTSLAQNTELSWDMKVDELTIEKVQKSLEARHTLKGARINGIRFLGGVLGLSYTAATLNSGFQLLGAEGLELGSAFSLFVNGATASSFLSASLKARKNFDERTIRKIMRSVKANEAVILQQLSSTLSEKGLTLVKYENHINNNIFKYFKRGVSKITLVIKEGEDGVPVEIELTHEVTYSKKQKKLGRFTYSKRSTQIGDLKFKATVIRNENFRLSWDVNSVIEKVKSLNTCDYLVI